LDFDNQCIEELESIFTKHKSKIKAILLDGLKEEQFGMDFSFIEK